MLCLGRSQGQNPRGRRPRRFWPQDLLRHNIHHDTSKVFFHKMSFLQHPGLVKRDFFQAGFGQWIPQGVHWTLYWAWTANIGRVKSQLTSPGCYKNVQCAVVHRHSAQMNSFSWTIKFLLCLALCLVLWILIISEQHWQGQMRSFFFNAG